MNDGLNACFEKWLSDVLLRLKMKCRLIAVIFAVCFQCFYDEDIKSRLVRSTHKIEKAPDWPINICL